MRSKRGGQRGLSEVVARRLLAWFRDHARDLPWRRTSDPYAIWVSEIMLQQTQVQTVCSYWERWMRELPDIATLARSTEDQVLKLWEGLGYYSRARNLRRAAQVIQLERGGELPQEVADWMALPGVGRYTAGAITSIAFNRPAPILDGNVIRVLTRLHGRRGNPKSPANNRRLWTLAEELVEAAGRFTKEFDRSHGQLNEALMELGATICRPTQPICESCPVQSHCVARQLGNPERFPETPARPRLTQRRFVTALVTVGDRWLVRQRGPGEVNAGLWEFPSRELYTGDPAGTEVLQHWLGIPSERFRDAGTIRHGVTRYRMTQQVQRADLLPREQERVHGVGLRWVTSLELEALALTGPHRKLAAKCQA